MKPFIYMHDIEYDRKELQDILETKTEWFDYGGTADAPIVNKTDVPDRIRKYFNYEDPFVTSGFVRVTVGYDLVPHEDEQILAPVFNTPRLLDPLPKYYVDWLKIISARESAISFPVMGDFTNVKTRMYYKDTKKYIDSFSLNVAPTFFITRGDYIHGVENTSDEPRILFQLSFKDHELYDEIYSTRPSEI